jgi:hypothetical protein
MKIKILIIFLIVIFAFNTIGVNADEGHEGEHMMGNFGQMGWFGLGWMSMILVWALIILAIVALVKYLGDKNSKK